MTTPAQPIQSQTLAGMVRAKYPGAYDDLDDATLEKNVLAKYPQYSDLPRSQASSPAQVPQEGFGGALWNDIKGIGQGIAGMSGGNPAGMAANAMQQGTQTAIDMGLRRQEGRSPAYNALASGMQLSGLMNPRPMEEAANTGDVSGVYGHTVVPVATAISPLILEGVGRVAGKSADLIPSTERAGAALQDIKTTAGSVPIDMAKPGASALELYNQSQHGATLPKAVRQFVQRATQPGGEPITYAEAKDFQSNVSRLSANERMNLNPNTARLLGQLNADLKGSLEDAADTVGKGQKFTDAMKEYHNAMTLKGWTDTAKAYAWKAALGALGVGAAKKIWDAFAD